MSVLVLAQSGRGGSAISEPANGIRDGANISSVHTKIRWEREQMLIE